MTTIINLTYPLDYAGKVYHTLTLRRMTARDLKRMDMTSGGDIAKAIDLVANLSELPPEAIEALDAIDFQQVNEAVASFLVRT